MAIPGPWIWVGAALVYGGFWLWYENWRGPLESGEIDAYLERFADAPESTPERQAVIRAFLEADDGGEFFMLNLIKLHEAPVVVGNEPARPADEVVGRYTRYFMPALFRRAGHPALVGPAAGGYVEHWGVEPDPGWTFSGVIRYRSRRDMMELATNPAFAPAHAYKIAAMASTLAFPVAPAFQLFSPRVVLGLALALFAALAHLASATLGVRG